MDKLIERLSELTDNRFSGTVTLSFYKGSLSKKIKLEVTENLKLDEGLIETDGINPNHINLSQSTILLLIKLKQFEVNLA